MRFIITLALLAGCASSSKDTAPPPAPRTLTEALEEKKLELLQGPDLSATMARIDAASSPEETSALRAQLFSTVIAYTLEQRRLQELLALFAQLDDTVDTGASPLGELTKLNRELVALGFEPIGDLFAPPLEPEEPELD